MKEEANRGQRALSVFVQYAGSQCLPGQISEGIRRYFKTAVARRPLGLDSLDTEACRITKTEALSDLREHALEMGQEDLDLVMEWIRRRVYQDCIMRITGVLVTSSVPTEVPYINKLEYQHSETSLKTAASIVSHMDDIVGVSQPYQEITNKPHQWC